MTELNYFQTLVNLIKKDEFYVTRQYQTLGGMWTVDTWERSGVKYKLGDEGYTQVITADGLEVVETGELYIIYRKGNEQMIKDLVTKLIKEND